MENSGQNYGPPVVTAPDPLVSRLNETDELRQIELDRLVSAKLALLWRHRRTLGWILLVGLVVSVAIALLSTKWYDSTVRLMPPDQQSNVLNMLMMSSGNNAGLSLLPGLLGMKTPGALFVGILASDSVCDRMIDRFDLMKEYGTNSREMAQRILRGKTDVSEDRKTNIISIVVSARSPQKAQAMANAYTEELSKVMNQVATSSARRERIFLEQRLAAVKADQDQAAKEFSTFAAKYTALDVPEQAKATLGAAARLQGELAAAESELQGLQQIYTDSNVRVKYLRGRTEELKRQLQTSGPSSDPSGNVDSLGEMIRNLPKLGVTWAQLYRRVTIDEVVYEALAKQLEFAKVQEAKELPTVSVLDPANLPERKAHPKRSIMVLVGLFLSFVLASAWIVTRDYWDRMEPDDARKVYVKGLVAPAVARWRNRQLPAAPAGELPYSRDEK